MVIGPTPHCAMGKVESERTVVGRRDLGDARFDYFGLVQRWFDHFLKGVENGATHEPKVRAYLMGANQWRSYAAWPVPEATPVSYYLDSDGGANSRHGNGRLATIAPKRAARDSFIYDPLHPVPSLGGSACCFPGLEAGSFDQTELETRVDVLVYTTPPLTEPIEVTGPVKVTLYLSSDARDTDLTVKLVDVHPDGKAFNLDETIQRVRWREGWDKPAALMEPGKVYRVELGPLVTSNAFLSGHRIRIEVSSSNFPRFERNLNTGGNNYDETNPVPARNTIHHGPAHPSVVILPVVRGDRP
jgi:putative CocE/NonD family hydrolase